MNAGVLEKVIPSPVRGDMVVVTICRDQISPVRGGMEHFITTLRNRPRHATPTGFCALGDRGFYKHATPTGLKCRPGARIQSPSPVRGDMVVVPICRDQISPVRGGMECRAYHGHQ